MANDRLRFDLVKKNLGLVKRELPLVLANQAKNYFVESWRRQGWDGVPWKIPQRRIPGTPAYKYPIKKGLGRRTRATLVETGRLRRDVSNSVRSANFELIRLVVDLPYANRHNEGLDGMPKRTFMGQTVELGRMQINTINAYISKIFV